MWPLPTLKNEYVSLILNADTISCCWIKKESSSCSVLAQQTFDADIPTRSMINQKQIQRHLSGFLAHHALENAFISLGISGSAIVEAIVELPTLSPKTTDFKFPKLKKMIWDFRYLYPKDNGMFVYYICGVSREALFQYQLLAINLSLNLITITTERMALFALYHHLHAQTFRHTKLAQDLIINNNELDTFFTPETIKRLSFIPSELHSALKRDPALFAKHLGLFITGDLL